MPVVIDRHRLLLALALVLTGCPPPTTNTPGSAPAVAPVSTQAYFVRLASLTIGGDFDGMGAEDVQVILQTNHESRRLFGTQELDLPDDSLRTFEFAQGRQIEVPAFPRSSLELQAFDVDVTDSELICGGSVDVPLEAYGDESTPARLMVDLGTIRGVAGGAFQAQRTLTIPGASCALALVRVLRRDTPDETSRALMTELFRTALDARAPANGSEAAALHDSLKRSLEQAEARAEASTHTYLRGAVPRLTASAERLLRAIGDATGPSAADLQESVGLLRVALGKATAEERAGHEQPLADLQALLDAGPPAITDAQALGAVLARLTPIVAALERPSPTPGGGLPPPPTDLQGLLDGYRGRLDGAGRSLAMLPAIGPLLTAFQAAIRNELGPS